MDDIHMDDIEKPLSIKKEDVHIGPSNTRPGFFVCAPDPNIESFLTESIEAANAKVEELKTKSKFPDLVYAYKCILGEQETGDGWSRLTWWPR